MIEASLSDRVAALRRNLRRATTYDDTLTTLSVADIATLRAVEGDFYPEPAGATVLRESIAQAHLHLLAHQQATHTRKVSPELVSAWAYATLSEWLPGHTDHDPRFGGQYHLRLQGIDEHTGGQLYQVTTPDGGDPRRFVVTLDVQLVADSP